MAELSEGVVINNRYRLLSYKGRGTFGEVWQALDEMLGTEVAVKVYVSLDVAGREEFKEEYRLTCDLHHNNLLTVSHFDEWEGRPFLVMKYCDRGSVAHLTGKMSEVQMWTFIRDVASGLAYLHTLVPEPIVHQDIKPDNILEDDYGRFLITDFGISKKIRATMRKQSGRATGAGAMAYMGPERFSKEPSPIKASDIWSLGVTICELATGELPFCGMGGGMLKKGAEMPSLGVPWSKELNSVMQACLAPEPWDRPTAAQLTEYASAKVDGREVFPTWNKKKEGGSSETTMKSDMRRTQLKGNTFTGKGTEPNKPRRKIVPPEKETGKKGDELMLYVFLFCIVGLTILLIIFSGSKDPLLKEAELYLPDYKAEVNLCESLINRGGKSDTESLLKAKGRLSDLKKAEDKYVSLVPEYNRSSTLERTLNVKLEDAAVAWAKAARSQYRINNKEKAKEYYLLALRLKENAGLREEYMKRFPN